VERRAEEPAIPLRLFRLRTFNIDASVSLIVGVALYGAITYLPTFLQVANGTSASNSEEIARRTGLDPDHDTYPLLVVTTAIGAMRLATAVWQERPRPGTLSDLVDETFDALAHGLTLLQPVGATAPSRPHGR
jgi:hypothetical protein